MTEVLYARSDGQFILDEASEQRNFMQIIKVLIFLHAILAMCEHRSSLEAKDNPAF